MHGSELAAAAAAAACEGRTAKANSVIEEIAKLAVQLSQDQLQASMAQVTLECMAFLEQHAKRCLSLLVEALRAPEATPEVRADVAWTLNKISQRCDVAKQWLVDARGLHAVRYALVTNPTHRNLVQCCIGIVYNLEGLSGLGCLLDGRVEGKTQALSLPESVLKDVLWGIYAQVKKEKESRCLDIAGTLHIVVQLLLSGSYDIEVQHACCSALAVMIHEDANLGAALIQCGGLPPVLNLFRHVMSLGSNGDAIASSCVCIISSLGEASTYHAEVIRQSGGMQLLAQFAMRGSGNSDEEHAMWAIGNIGGIPDVFQLMTFSPNCQSVIRGGLTFLAEFASSAAVPIEVTLLPKVLSVLMQLLEQTSAANPPIKCRKKCLAAICSSMIGIVPHAEPGEVKELDQVIQMLLHQQMQDLRSETDVDVVENIVESLGRVALIKPSWRDFLKRLGAEQIFSQRIRSGTEHRRILKYAFWAAAALAGLPFVCNELQMNLRSADTIDAAFCTIIDILDDDLEGEWMLTSAERCQEQFLPVVFNLIVEAMQGYITEAVLQTRGCHCIGLLASIAPMCVPPSVVVAISKAARRHARSQHVLRDALFAFHALLEPSRRCNQNLAASLDSRRAVLDASKEVGIEEIVEQALKNHGNAYNAELIEEAVVVYCCVSGIAAALQVLVEAGNGPVRTVGCKAIAEFGRHQPLVLQQSASQVVSDAVEMARQCPGDDALQQHVSLLLGLCGSHANASS